MHLRGIHTLCMYGCSQASITDAAFVHLRGIHTLDISFCNQAGITGATFKHLRGILVLRTYRLDLVDAARRVGLTSAVAR